MYGGVEIILEKTFEELANEFDKSCNGMLISVYKKRPLLVNFLYRNRWDKIKCFKNDIISKICEIFVSKNKIKLEKCDFYHNNTKINIFQTFYQLLKNNNTCIKHEDLNYFNDTQNIGINNKDEINTIEEIQIKVVYCCCNSKNIKDILCSIFLFISIIFNIVLPIFYSNRCVCG